MAKSFPYTIINLTPHRVLIYGAPSGPQAFHPTGVVAEAELKRSTRNVLDIPCFLEGPQGAVDGIPAQEELGVLYIVLDRVRTALASRRDLVSPGPEIRNEQGVVLGYQGFVCNGGFLSTGGV
jgi:hypothetical protein